MLFNKKSKNNRMYPRVDFFQPSYFIVENEENSPTNECWFTNISLGGLAFESDRDNLNESVVNILYKIGPQLRKDRLQIRFTRKLMSKWRYGCQFISPDERRNELISQFVVQKLNT